MKSTFNTIPTVTTVRTPTGFAAECSACGVLDERFPWRPGADLHAVGHVREHGARGGK